MADLLRLQSILLKGIIFSKRVDLRHGTHTSLRVLINDLDINLHMTNSRYLKAMDLGRWDLFTQSGALRTCYENRWRMVVGSLKINYFKSLTPFQSYSIWTRLVEWDDRWLIFRQSFIRDGRTYCDARVLATVLGPHGVKIPVQKAMVDFGISEQDYAEGFSRKPSVSIRA